MKRLLSIVLISWVSVVCLAQQNSLGAQANVKGRRVSGSLPRPTLSYYEGAAGVVVVTVKVDQYGNVTEAIPGAEGTTLINQNLWDLARNAALKAHFNQSADSPAVQVGTITYEFGESLFCAESDITSLRDLVMCYERGVFRVKARYVQTYDVSDLLFSVEEEDYEIPIQLLKKDLGAEKRFRALNLHPGDTLILEGMLEEIYVRGHSYKGLDEAVILDVRPSSSDGGEETEGSYKDVPLQVVDQKPTFNGGDANEFSKWVNEHLQYPQSADCIQGRVTVQFTVKTDGSVTDVKVLRGVSPDLDKEAVRVVSSSPKWKPGRSNGKAVDVTYTFPVIFQLR